MSPPAAPSATVSPSGLLRGVSRSFYLSIRLLPGPLRRPVGLAYLLARATDTVADSAELPAPDRAALLQALAGAIASGGRHAPQLQRIAAEFAPLQSDEDERRLLLALPSCLDELQSLPEPDRADIRTVLRHITRGQLLDVERFGAAGPCRALASAAELEHYTYLVAGSVGEFWTDLCLRHLPRFATLPQQQMRELGCAYGRGLQLVNILRDVPADLASGRCYLPADELAAAGCSPVEAAQQPERLLPVWKPWLARAGSQLAQGMRYADAVNSRRVRAASALPALLGARTLALLHEAGPQVLVRKVKMPRAEVRGVLLHLALTLAGRASLRSQFDRLQRGGVIGGWDNPAR